MSPTELLKTGIAQMQLQISESAQLALLQYLDLLAKWNKVYNLTAVRDQHAMMILHVLDSLSVLPYIQSSNLLDVGSGAGLPGIVLAIVKPELSVTTIDAVQKKTIFMRQVQGALKLSNLQVVHGRVEQFKPARLYSEIISRAFSEIALFMRLTKHLLAENGRWLAMKGTLQDQELQNVNLAPAEMIRLNVAHLQAERHLLIFENHA